MQLIRDLNDYTPTMPLALAIGNFDGLHLGHRAVLARMMEAAQAQGLGRALLTFEPHPRRFFAPDAPPFRLQTLHDKLADLQALGVEYVFALRFNAAFAGRTAEDFLTLLEARMRVRAVVTGENFVFGRGRGGDAALLEQWGAAHGITIHAVPPVAVGGQVCSSTTVRAALERGEMTAAAALLGHPYAMTGRVRHGDKRGRELGYPTANILPPVGMKLPRFGIYAMRVRVDGQAHGAVASLGIRPMFALARPQLEVHLLDYAGDLYGKKLRVEYGRHLRDEKRFDSLAALTQQMGEDAAMARQWLQENA
jgi:riboflavin kinase/FMN adenylyltransferase